MRFYKSLLVSIIIISTLSTGIRADWEWVNPIPAGNTFNGIGASENGYMAVCGEAGLVLEKASGDFFVTYSASGKELFDLQLSGEYGVVAGENNTVLLRDHDGWRNFSPPSTSWFYGVDIQSDGMAWICGDLGKIFRYDLENWTEFSSGSTTTFKDIEMVNSEMGWVVGLYGTVRQFDGTSWQYVNSHTSRFLRHISAYSPNTAWAVGDLGTIIYWNGTQFNVETNLTSATLRGVLAISETEAWAVGNTGTVLHCVDNVWSLENYPELGDQDLKAITQDHEGTLWVTGTDGFIAYLENGIWVSIVEDFTGAQTDIYDVEYHFIQDHVFLSGERGAMWVSSPSGFIPYISGTSAEIYRMFIETDGTFWATGSRGLVIRDSGSGWETLNPATTDDFHDIYVMNGSNVWAAGGHSDGTCVSWTAAYYDGDDWTIYSESGS